MSHSSYTCKKNIFIDRFSAGFTLIEILVVLVILGLLIAIVAPNVMERIPEAQVTKARADIRSLESSLNIYKLDNFSYPTTDQGLEALVARPAGSPEPRNWKRYMDRLPKDPWGNDYQYLSPGTNGDIDIFSFGADGRPGGQGADADIGNWNLQ